MNRGTGLTKIFVLGRHRSRTTLLANIVASHPKIFTPEHEAHRGQHESEFFSSVVPYCRLADTPTDRLALRALSEVNKSGKRLPHGFFRVFGGNIHRVEG